MIWSLIEIAFVAVMILVIAGLAALAGVLTAAVVIALCVFVVASFIAWLIAFVLRPKKHHDHYAKPFGEYPPKVPHGPPAELIRCIEVGRQ